MNLFVVILSGAVGAVVLLLGLLAQVLEWTDKLEKYPALKKFAEAKALRVVLLVVGIGLLAGVLEEANRVREALERPPAQQKVQPPTNPQADCNNAVPASPNRGGAGVSGNKVVGKDNVLGTVTQQGKNNIAQQGNGNNATINAVPPPRRIASADSAAMLPMLMASKPTVNVRAPMGDNEAQQLGVDIYSTLKAARWTMQNPIVMSFTKVGGPVEPGVTVFIHGAPVTGTSQLTLPDTDPKMALANLLRKSGISVNFVPQLDTPEGIMDIQVGPAPNPD
jgi:hypothetical protein